MSNENSLTDWRENLTPHSIDVDGNSTCVYDEWSDERLVDGYRRNSILLREYGTDSRTIQALCAIEDRLRDRNIDPDEIVEGLDGPE